jgi:hypothetical protein
MWVTNGCADNVSCTSEVPQVADHFVQHASRQRWARNGNATLESKKVGFTLYSEHCIDLSAGSTDGHLRIWAICWLA